MGNVVELRGWCWLCGRTHEVAHLMRIEVQGGEPIELGPCCRDRAALSLHVAGVPANDIATEPLELPRCTQLALPI